MEEKIKQLFAFIEEAENIVFFGGAGVSTESGIPDFRSKDGLYNQHEVTFEDYSPEYLLSNTCLSHEPKVFFEFYRQKLDTRHIEPNITHRVLAKMEERGRLSSVITQNIDGLHQKAGSKKVIELHGTTARNYCVKTKEEYPSDYIFESKEIIPRCKNCGNIVRPDVTLYGEALPKGAAEKAIEEIKKANMLIIAGTSLRVYPAAGLVNYFRGEHLVVMNKEDLGLRLREGSDLIFTGKMGEVFLEIEKWLLESL